MAFKARDTGESIADQNFAAIESELSRLALAVLADRAVEYDVTTTGTRCYHALNRAARGRVIVAQSADARIWDGPSTRDYWTLYASADCTVKVLWL